MEQLEDYLVKYKDKHQKIWYMADGIYSMYGDHAPIDKLKQLIKKYPCLHIYFDDVHGMSWIGERGAGFVKSHWSKIPENMVLISTLSKTFGASGATIICGDKELQPDVVVYDRFMIEEQFGWRVRENCKQAIQILDTEDLHFVRKAREKAFKKQQEVNYHTDEMIREVASILRCDLSLIISEVEMEMLQREFNIPETFFRET